MIGSTYSIFTSSDIDENSNIYTTGNLNITYTLSSDNIKFEDITPMSLEERYAITPYRITVTNNGNVPYMFDVILDDTTAGDVINYQYIMTEVGQLDPIALNECTNNVIKEDVIVPANSSVNVDVRIWISDTIQNTEIGKSFYGKLVIDGLAVYDKNTNIDNSILEAITKFYGEDYYYDEATQKYISVQNSEIQFTNTVSTYDYTGSSQTFTADHQGVYKLEAWGAQGGTANSNRGGYGGYSVGNTKLSRNTTLYIYVGGQGASGTPDTARAGGYNGGGSVPVASSTNRYVSGGGGATHIATSSGLLSDLSSKVSSILIVAGGGGGGYEHTTSGFYGVGGDGGGYTGSNGKYGSSGGANYGIGGSQTSAGYANDMNTTGVGGFGYGGNVGSGAHGSAGGGGYYGGGGSGGVSSQSNSSGGGGSGYIGNNLLTSKKMYCYSCETSTNVDTYTISTTNTSSTATSNYSKQGNGYAKITPAIPTITSGSLTVAQGNILDVSSIGCVDKGAGCTIAQIYPRDTRSLEKGTHDIYILVKDDYDTIYKYTKSFTVT